MRVPPSSTGRPNQAAAVLDRGPAAFRSAGVGRAAPGVQLHHRSSTNASSSPDRRPLGVRSVSSLPAAGRGRRVTFRAGAVFGHSVRRSLRGLALQGGRIVVVTDARRGNGGTAREEGHCLRRHGA